MLAGLDSDHHETEGTGLSFVGVWPIDDIAQALLMTSTVINVHTEAIMGWITYSGSCGWWMNGKAEIMTLILMSIFLVPNLPVIVSSYPCMCFCYHLGNPVLQVSQWLRKCMWQRVSVYKPRTKRWGRQAMWNSSKFKETLPEKARWRIIEENTWYWSLLP